MEENNISNKEETLNDNTGKNQAITSLVLGVVSLLSCFTGIGAIIGLVTGIIGLIFASKAKKNAYIEAMQTGGFVCSLVGLIISAIILILSICLIGTIFGLLSRATTYGMYTWY